jgi:hypothetical protein
MYPLTYTSTSQTHRNCARLADLLELRKLRKARGGIDVAKLNKGDIKKKKKRAREEGEEGGLKKGVPEDEECVLIVTYIA